MKYALIGCGRISPNHIEAAKNNNLEIVAISDIVEIKMKETIERFSLKNVKSYVNYKEMIESERPELVAIATESGKHAEIALFCIENGCNLIIEKPIALSINDADLIINLAKQKGVKVCVNHQNRFNKSIQYIRNAVDEGRFGKLFYATARILWNRNEEYYSQSTWRGTWEQDGGCLMNQCIHNIDLLCWLMNSDVKEVFAYTDRLNHSYIEAEDLGISLIKFTNGTYGVIEGTTNVFPKNLEESLYIFGSNGTVKAAGKSVNILEECFFSDENEDYEVIKKKYSENPPNVYGYGHTPLYANVVESIIFNKKPLVDAEDGKKAMEVVLAIYKSAAEHRPIEFPLNMCSTVDYLGRFDNE